MPVQETLKEAGLTPGSGRCPPEEEMATHSSVPACESQGQRSVVGYSLQCGKELDTTEATQQAGGHWFLLQTLYSDQISLLMKII